MSRQNLIAIGLVVALVAASLFFGYRWGRNSVTPEIITKTEYKTIRVKDPTPSLSYNTGRLIFVPVKATESQSDSTTHLAPLDAPAASPDSIAANMVVELPEEVKEYADTAKTDDGMFIHYRIGVKGYNPSLAYADFSVPYTHSYSVVERKQPIVEVAVGPTAGFGYGMINRNPDFFVGLGVTLKFNLRNR